MVAALGSSSSSAFSPRTLSVSFVRFASNEIELPCQGAEVWRLFWGGLQFFFGCPVLTGRVHAP